MQSQSPLSSAVSPDVEGLSVSRRALLGVFAAGSVTALAGCLGAGRRSSGEWTEEQLRDAASQYLTTATLYKTPNCMCCVEYMSYLQGTVGAAIEIVEVNDLAVIKEHYHIPRAVESCHTLDIGEYFIEGHVPIEAIGKLALKRPDIAGIALPEMPLGSPGMPGPKTEELVIYAVESDGTYREFMVL